MVNNGRVLKRKRIQGRLALAIVLTALIPVISAIVLARSMVQQSSDRFFVPEIRQHLELGLSVYGELAKELKANMRQRALTMAADPALVAALRSGDQQRLVHEVKRLRQADSQLVLLELIDDDDRTLAKSQRSEPLDEQKEKPLNVIRPLALAPDSKPLKGAPMLRALFATPAHRFQEFQEYGEFIDAYSKLEERREADEQTYVLAFAALLGITILGAVGVGSLLARGVARRVSVLGQATQQVGAGDLSVRVHDETSDELGELARAFNQMLEEVETSRGRIEYLSRLASWQEMARRLAHEIKNPLTPIQLAVQEVHQRLQGLSDKDRALLDTTLEIVEAEVAALRRLVGEFSEFARLPESHPARADLFGFLRSFASQTDLLPELFDTGHSSREVDLSFELPEQKAEVCLDEQMMRRVLVNLIQNAVQACRGVTERPKVSVSAERQGDFYLIHVDDNGSGIPESLRTQVFEPYVTTKDDGTGLGLAIVKKVMLDHSGLIRASQSPLGGARFTLQLPRYQELRTELDAPAPALLSA